MSLYPASPLCVQHSSHDQLELRVFMKHFQSNCRYIYSHWSISQRWRDVSLRAVTSHVPLKTNDYAPLGWGELIQTLFSGFHWLFYNSSKDALPPCRPTHSGCPASGPFRAGLEWLAYVWSKPPSELYPTFSGRWGQVLLCGGCVKYACDWGGGSWDFHMGFNVPGSRVSMAVGWGWVGWVSWEFGTFLVSKLCGHLRKKQRTGCQLRIFKPADRWVWYVSEAAEFPLFWPKTTFNIAWSNILGYERLSLCYISPWSWGLLCWAHSLWIS